MLHNILVGQLCYGYRTMLINKGRTSNSSLDHAINYFVVIRMSRATNYPLKLWQNLRPLRYTAFWVYLVIF